MRTWMMFYRVIQSFCVFPQGSLKLERLDEIVTLSLILILRGASHERKIHITSEVKRSDLTWIGACGSNPPPNLGGTERKVWDHISCSVHSPRHTHTPHRDILNVLCCKHPQLREQCPASRCVSGGKVAGSSCTSADTHKIKLKPPVDARIPLKKKKKKRVSGWATFSRSCSAKSSDGRDMWPGDILVKVTFGNMSDAIEHQL